MELFTYKGIADGKYVEGDIEALNQEEASHKLKEQKVIITNLIKAKKKSKDGTKAKAKKGVSYGTLVKVYRRGQAAYMSSGSRPNTSMAAWAMGRVNSFIGGSKKHDTDLR